jgi:hypothetical protein
MSAPYPEPDIAAIRQHVELLHHLAAPLADRGKLVVASFGQDPRTAKDIVSKIRHFQIGDVDTMVEIIARLCVERHRNVYAPTAVMRLDLPDGKVGGEADVVGVIGLVEDFDDDDAPRWAERLPIAASYALETSVDRVQAFLMTDNPVVETADAKRLAVKLKAFTHCDHGSADLSHVWRVAGTLNWPNSKNLKAGRPADPQIVRVIKQCTQVLENLTDLEAYLGNIPVPPEPAPKVEPNGHDQDIAKIIAKLPKWLLDRLLADVSGGSERSNKLFPVVAALCERHTSTMRRSRKSCVTSRTGLSRSIASAMTSTKKSPGSVPRPQKNARPRERPESTIR